MSARATTLEDIVKPKRGRGRPRKEVSRADETRPTRVPVSGNRDILTVQGKDPEYEYRWVTDVDEAGQRIFRFTQGGWDFARTEQGLKIGQSFVYKSENVGSIVRQPAGRTSASSGQYQYLMRIRKDWYLQDQQAKEDQLKAVEDQIYNPDRDMSPEGLGQYGKVSVDTEFRYAKQD